MFPLNSDSLVAKGWGISSTRILFAGSHTESQRHVEAGQ
nr:MAG TPA: hypothetical protein [Caudoviricetes sp.]